MKRFYKTAGVDGTDGGYSVTLDGRRIKTPMGRSLIVSSRDLAAAIAEEWDAQPEEIRPESMPLMRLAATAIDRVADNREAVIRDIVRFAETELLCYWSEHPEDLASRQLERWQPLLDWLDDVFGARLTVTRGILPVPQPPEAIEAIRGSIKERSDEELVVLHDMAGAMGSLALALAAVSGRLDAQDAFELSRLDEAFQNERWGEDDEAISRNELLRRDVLAAGRFLALAREAAV
ncbi:MAG: ATPase [Rhodospirillales bacterium]|nr:ATPase [Rhodospirillales bacterium]MCW8862979.1 ATPase [Rhodospirillales bacterium]MCW8951583.1 ATPase [Rhodospirillales bacterium]MCW9003100.1 ATPase [Rhodospirillales bacterium]MCW9040600.1 ATPase [Rhodospirillales bacterium]